MADPATAARDVAPPIDLHLARGDTAATLYVRESTGHDAHAALVQALRELRARIDTAIVALDPPRDEDAPSQAAIERSQARVLHLVDERRRTAPAWRARFYATLLAHCRTACPEAEIVAASEVRT